MSKGEIALELTKLAYDSAIHANKLTNNSKKPEEVVTELYNYIFTNMGHSEQNN